MRWLLMLGVIGIAAGCGSTKLPPCDASTCNGCCDANGQCARGNLDSACGSNGASCAACGVGASCNQGACATPNGTPDSGSATDGGSTAPVCPAAGQFCGANGVQHGDPTILYTCAGAGQAPTSTAYCVFGCALGTGGVSDRCNAASSNDGGVETAPICPGSGPFCGSDGVANGAANTLYQCPGQGQAPTSAQLCAAGCTTNPPGTPDTCASSNGPSCPGAGPYCGSDGVTNGAANTLYQCPGQGQPPSSSQPCANGCNVQPAGTPDYCNGSPSDGGTKVTPICPGGGPYCGSDGVTNGDPNTLYQCPGANQAPSSSQYCSSGCKTNPPGTPDVCNASSGVTCPGKGAYCGSDGVTGGDANTLYECPGQGQAPTGATPCASGCNVQPAGTPDFCNGSSQICPGKGDYCGSDGVTNGDPNTLYHCPGAGMAPGSSTPCSSGCQVEPAGTPDFCKGTTPICPGAGPYCGNDGVANGDANTLYQCPGANQAPTSSQSCAQGCSVQPAGTPDYCVGSQPTCPGSGAFCGSDGVTGGNANTLYQCPGAGQAPSSATACADGCNVQPSGTPDFCNASCPGTGAFCGSDGVTGGSSNTLYQCPGAGQAPTSQTVCPAGCSVQPAGTPDYCNGSCSGFVQTALGYEASKIAAGEGGNCNGGPPYCYSDYCLGFVNDAYSYAGHHMSQLQQYDAANSMYAFQNSGNWHAWNGSCPCGGILFWAPNNCNGGYGHIVICNGDGTVSTSGWSNYGGGTHVSITWLDGEECGHAPAGYANPY